MRGKSRFIEVAIMIEHPQSLRSTPDAKIALHYMPTAALKPDAKNARRHSRQHVQQLAASIELFGFAVPILVDADDQVIAGHGRLLAANYLGLPEIPVVRLAHLTPAQARALQIADNRLTEISTWDEHLLALNLKELSDLDFDFSLEVTGFSMGEIDVRIESLDEPDIENVDPADHVPSPRSDPVSEPGDLWVLGDHRVLCADALDTAPYVRLMDGARADLVFTDPPYNVAMDGHAGGNGAIHHREFLMGSGELSAAEFERFLETVALRVARFSRPGAVTFVCMDWRHLSELMAAGRSASLKLLNLCVWVKNQAGLGSLYRSQHELVAVFRNGSAAHTNNVKLGKDGRHRTNVWNYPGIHVERRGEEGDLLASHPTVKPVRLVADAILDCSDRGGLVLDPFLGSGTTLIAAHRVGRICNAIEIDPLYVDVAIRRWQADTGEKAVHAASGESFAERAQRAKATAAADAGMTSEVSHEHR
jgi:DNA modification methylase